MASESFKGDFPTAIVNEGNVRVLVPRLEAFVKSPSEYAPSKAPVFYNPVMELNRDLAVLALQAYQTMVDHDISVCEPFTGCGLRGIRFATEVRGVKKVVISDINQTASRLAQFNVKINGLARQVIARNEEANLLLNSYGRPRKRFDAIDIDPFGSPVYFIDSAIRALRSGGLLALTATDMAPLCGVHTRACIRKYGGKPLRTEYCHELAVRLLAGCLAIIAARYDVGVSVVFSHQAEHYVRIYTIIEHGAKRADECIKNMGYMQHCFKCFHRKAIKGEAIVEHSESCSECGSKLEFAGPLWLGKLSNTEFCELMNKETKNRDFRLKPGIRKLLTKIQNEIEAPISYFVVDKISDALNSPVPPTKRVMEVLRVRGFQAALTHFNPRGIRSDAPPIVVKEIVRELAYDKS